MNNFNASLKDYIIMQYKKRGREYFVSDILGCFKEFFDVRHAYTKFIFGKRSYSSFLH